ncbi:MAG: tetratricopeptide repeat protein [Planctomycetes bacterium]|nr:tetratricopeptide repeat protein [Planctomycetota bacterium]
MTARRHRLSSPLAALVLLASAWAQAPSPDAAATAEAMRALAVLGERQLERDDAVEARRSFLLLRQFDAAAVDGLVGLGRAHLQLGSPWIALAYADEALARAPVDDGAAGLRVRALLRARRFQEALDWSAEALRGAAGDTAGPQLWSAHASALFRSQRIDAAAAAYRHVLELDPSHAEAHLRLGSGLTRPCDARLPASARAALDARRAGDLGAAIDGLQAALREDSGNPVVHRLLGEALLERRARRSIVGVDPAFVALQAALPVAEIDPRVAEAFMPQLAGLTGPRRIVAERALALFATRLPRVVGRSGRHDLLLEDERTTDAPARASLRGERTFDGRVWDDVRGIGGLQAATGIEALDDAASFGFDVLAHEVAHQAHLFGFRSRAIDARIRDLYRDAIADERCLDYYAASNHAEYFAQGVEAFHCLAKRPATEPTHGHTRFELMRLDPALHQLICELVDRDPLAGAPADPTRVALLRAAIDAALRTGRTEDAITAAELLPAGEERHALMSRARAAAFRSRSI